MYEMISEYVIAISGATVAAIAFTFGMRAIASVVIIETSSSDPPERRDHKMTRLTIRAMIFFIITFVTIMLTHN